MVSNARKLYLIEELLKIRSDKVLAEVEAVLKKASVTEIAKTKLSDRFAGKLSSETGKQLQDYVAQSRNEWERNI